MSVPTLPEDLIDHGMTDDELADLWHKLVVELLNSQYSGRTHHNRRTYDAGCRGPLCCKSVREYGRRRSQTSPNEKYKYIDPILDHWKPVAVERIEVAQRAVLEQLTAS